jgi:iron complex transport system substrate-binding protein
VSHFPSRIVCLTEETTETLYLLGEGDRVAGVSGYTVRPPEARLKPKVSAFINARFDKIEALKPDLVLAFSDLQADIARELIRRGYPVYTFNQRSVADILQMIRIVGALVGRADAGDALASKLEAGLDQIAGRPWRDVIAQQPAEAPSAEAPKARKRPRVFFEEWNDPLIAGIRWVEELIEIAGGDPIFPELRNKPLGKDRIVDPAAVIERNPDIIIGSWCGKALKKRTIVERPGWDRINAVRNDQIHEIKSTYILQPGPASLTEGVQQLHAILNGCVAP